MVLLSMDASCSSVICSLDNYINAVRAGLYFELSGNIYRIINTSNTRKYGFGEMNIFEGDIVWLDFMRELLYS